MTARSRLDDGMMDVIRRGMCTKRTEPDMASELGVCVRTIASAKKRIRAEWARNAMNAKQELSDIYGRLQYLEDQAFKDRRWREARECLALRMRLTAAAQPERKAAEQGTQIGVQVVTRTEIVVVDPPQRAALDQPAAEPAAEPEPVTPADLLALPAGIVVVDPAWPKS